MSEEYVTLRMPQNHWSEIRRNLENHCGRSEDEIEILGDVTVVNE